MDVHRRPSFPQHNRVWQELCSPLYSQTIQCGYYSTRCQKGEYPNHIACGYNGVVNRHS